jgi:hypothetical protein
LLGPAGVVYPAGLFEGRRNQMAFKFFEEHAAKRQAEWDSHVRPEMRALATRPERITLAEWNELRANSYERHEIIKNLDDEALMDSAKHCMGHCGRHDRRLPPSCHDDALVLVYVPLLLERLAAKAVQE